MAILPPDGRRLIARWDAWVSELEDHPLDQFEYLGALECREDVETWLNISGDQSAMDDVANIDARFEDITCEDGRFAEHFGSAARVGWWWARMPKDPDAQRYIVDDWR